MFVPSNQELISIQTQGIAGRLASQVNRIFEAQREGSLMLAKNTKLVIEKLNGEYDIMLSEFENSRVQGDEWTRC